MNANNRLKIKTAVVAATVTLALGLPRLALAHCDTLDGPVIQDARRAIDSKDVTPVLKWVRTQDEKGVKSAFNKVLAAKGKNVESAEKQFFTTLVKVHRAGEGAPFTGLKPAGAVEPTVAEADKTLADGSADALVKLVTDDVATGLRKRFVHAAETYRHKDESVARGREFVKAYVEFTHYVERLHMDATSKVSHGESPEKSHYEHHEDAGQSHSGHGAAKH